MAWNINTSWNVLCNIVENETTLSKILLYSVLCFYRLYSMTLTLCVTEEDFEMLPPSTVPEMQRSNLAPVILQLKALGIDNVLRFSFLSVSVTFWQHSATSFTFHHHTVCACIVSIPFLETNLRNDITWHPKPWKRHTFLVLSSNV